MIRMGSGRCQPRRRKTSSGSISGLIAPDGGYLVGVFLAAGGPSGSAPSPLNFTGSAIAGYTTVTGGTGFSALSPLLDQMFFIGDGLTGNGTGSTQQFFVPTGATELVLGISDACGYNGSPSCYADNLGTYTVTASVVNSSSVPEPASFPLVGAGIMAAVAVRRRMK